MVAQILKKYRTLQKTATSFEGGQERYFRQTADAVKSMRAASMRLTRSCPRRPAGSPLPAGPAWTRPSNSASVWETAAETGSSSIFCSMTAACPAVIRSFGRKTRPRSETMPLTMPRAHGEAQRRAGATRARRRHPQSRRPERVVHGDVKAAHMAITRNSARGDRLLRQIAQRCPRCCGAGQPGRGRPHGLNWSRLPVRSAKARHSDGFLIRDTDRCRATFPAASDRKGEAVLADLILGGGVPDQLPFSFSSTLPRFGSSAS